LSAHFLFLLLTARRKRLPLIGASQADVMLLFDGFFLRRRDRRFENLPEKPLGADIGGTGLPQGRAGSCRMHYSLVSLSVI
jgi:hypothetical protein